MGGYDGGLAMGNVIKRNTVFIEATAVTNSCAYEKGTRIGLFKRDSDWLSKRDDGKYWKTFISHIRNEHYYSVNKQYSIEDIVDYLRRRNRDYYTVMWEMIVDAINTTFDETEVKCIDDIYEYVNANLL